MGDLGERLRQEREARGVSLDEIARNTRIGVRLLKAIEEETFDQLPGGIFNKSFVQQYAQYLELDEKQAVRDYLRATAAVRETQYPQSASAPPSSIFASKAFLRLALGSAAIVLVAFLVWLMIRGSRPQPDFQIAAVEPPGAATSQETATPISNSKSVFAANSQQTERSANEIDSPVGSALPPRATAASRSPAEVLMESANREPLAGELPEELLLQINARSTVWISITADGERQWQGTMKPNQSREVQATETIRLTVGNAGGVELTLNGKNLGALGGEGEVKTVTLAARALQEVVP